MLADQVDIAMVSRELKPQEKEKGALAYAVAKDAVVATINANNPVYRELLKTGLSQKQATAIWEGKTKLNVYTRSDAGGAAETWAAFLGKKQEDLKGTGVFGDPGVAENLAEGCERYRIQQHRLCL